MSILDFYSFLKDYRDEDPKNGAVPNSVEEWLGKDNELGISIWNRKYRYKNESFPAWIYRVSGGNLETARLIVEKKFLFGGRILSNRGADDNAGMINCFSSGVIEDDYRKILDTLKDVGLTLKAQGGQGVSFSELRPKGSPVGQRYQSDGIVPFMKMYNAVTDGTANGGSRRGALMMELDAKHKDAMDFISIKQNTDQINAANLSLVLDDEFMDAVDLYYETGEVKTLHMKKEYSGHLVEWDVTPIDVFKALAKNAWSHAEPGCIFDWMTQNHTMLEHYDELMPLTHNPCAEQILAKNMGCCLGSINLSAFVKHPFTDMASFDTEGFRKAVRIATRELDVILDENMDRFPLPEQREMAEQYRNIGVGVMGYADMLIKMGIAYGTNEAIVITNEIFTCMIKESFSASISGAKKKGAFPKFDRRITESQFVKENISPQDIYRAEEHGLRNCSLLTIAPTGSLATMLEISSGGEPVFAFKHQRRMIGDANNGEQVYDVYSRIARDYMAETGNTELPSDIFVEAGDIDCKARVRTQAIIQRYIDTGISSTVNLPEETTVEEIEQLYLMAWKYGCKGITVYRAVCEREAILTKNESKAPDKPKQAVKEDKKEELEDSVPSVLKRGDIVQHNDDNIIKIRALQSGCGKVYVHAHFDPDTGNLIEIFLDRGGSGGCERYMNGLSRMASLAARGGVSTEDIIDQLMSVGQCAAYVSRRVKYRDASKGACCPGAIGYALQEMWDEVRCELFDDDEDESSGLPIHDAPIVLNILDKDRIKEENSFPQPKENTPQVVVSKKEKGLSLCPECSEPSLAQEGGCNSCKSCGFSSCG